jgi:hypothetical protein
MLKHVLLERTAIFTLALGFLSFPSFGQRIARSRSTAVALSADASSSKFFPLAAGNSWTYNFDRLGPDKGVTVEVGDPVEINGVSYFPVTGLAGAEALLRSDSRGRVYQYKRDESREALWWDFATPMGGTWIPEFPDGCTGQATVAERNAAASVTAGTFPETVRVQYGPGDCADAGITEEIFSAGVGLLSRTETTIAGPRTMRLAQARVGGRTIEGTGLSFSVRVDKPVYTPNLMPPVDPEKAIPVLKATVTVENSSDIPVTITFPSTQLFDLSIRNARGESVYTWSANKLFAAVVTEIELGRRVFEEEIPLGQGEKPLPPGMYVLEAWLVAPDGKAFSGSVAFEVAQPAQ